MINNQKIKVTFFCGSLNIGGTERNVVNILKNINREKFEPKLCCLFSGGSYEQEVKDLRITTLIFNHMRLYDLGVYFKVIKFFRGSDILHCFGYPPIYFGIFLGRLAGAKKIIVAVQDRDVWKKWRHILLDKLIRPFVDLYIADGKGARKFAITKQAIASEKIITIYDGADIDAFKFKKTKDKIRTEFGISKIVPVIGVICRLDDKKKGVSYFIKAAPFILKNYPDAMFLIVGDGKDRQDLEELSFKHNIANKIIFAGFRKDVIEVLNAIDILVIPSIWESVPKILIDAMALGKTIVSTNVGDIPELLTNNKTGVLIMPGDQKEIAEAVISLLKNETKAVELKKEAIKEVEKKGLSLKKSMEFLKDKYIEIYYTNISPYKRFQRYLYFAPLFPIVALSFFVQLSAEKALKSLVFTTFNK